MIKPEINEVILGFTPQKNDDYQIKEIQIDETLFVPKNMESIFTENKLMFPLLSHA